MTSHITTGSTADRDYRRFGFGRGWLPRRVSRTVEPVGKVSKGLEIRHMALLKS